MGYDIESSKEPDIPRADTGEYYHYCLSAGYFARFNADAWPMLLRLAETYGWKPEGTRPGEPFYLDGNGERDESKDPAKWEGSYLWNNGQVVTAADAAALADALERALPDIPDHEIAGKVVKLSGDAPGFSGWMAQQGFEVMGPNPDIHPFEYFSGALKLRVVSFIQLCRKGEFAIW